MKQGCYYYNGKPDRNYKDEDDNVIFYVQQTKNELPSIRKKILS
jgi:hypothetical protein